AGRRMPGSSSMPWSRPFMSGVPFMAAASSITAIAVSNTSRSSIRSDWPRRESSLPSEASATLTTTPSPKRSTVSTRPRSFIGADHGGASKRLNSPLWNGSTGSTIDGFWSRSATSRQPKPRSSITPCWTNQLWLHNLNQTASGKPGAVQCDAFWQITLRDLGRVHVDDRSHFNENSLDKRPPLGHLDFWDSAETGTAFNLFVELSHFH